MKNQTFSLIFEHRAKQAKRICYQKNKVKLAAAAEINYN